MKTLLIHLLIRSFYQLGLIK